MNRNNNTTKALDWITVKGFKSIKGIEKLEIRPINVLIGANGSGKSNFIGVFSFLNSICAGGLQNYVARTGGANKLLHFGKKRTSKIEIGISFRLKRNHYKIQLSANEADSISPTHEAVGVWNKVKYSDSYEDYLTGFNGEAGIADRRQIGNIIRYVRMRLNSWRIYQFHDTSSTSPMKMTADVNDNRYLRSDGSNLAAFLYLLQMKHEEYFNEIRQTVQLAAPFFDDFQLEPLALNEDKIRLEWRHIGSDAYFDASSLSDGSLRFIALVTLFLQPEVLRPSVILLDEPELGLHPYAITLLASLVKLASADSQIILATQSSLLLDHFEPEDVVVANRVNGATEFTRFDEEDLEEWLQEYSLGQLWEKNELDGRPVPENTGKASK